MYSASSFGSSRTTISRFARGNGAVNFSGNGRAIELDQLSRLAPSVFAESPHDSRSERYTYIPTSQVLQALMREGFRPYSVMQGGSRDEAKRGFTKHLLRLRHDSQVQQVGGTHNEIVLLNSHDGTSSYRLMAGVFRLVCGNGLVVAENMVEDIRIPHKGDITGQVIDGCVELLTKLPEISDSIRQMDSLRLSEGERTVFAQAALVARYGEEQAPVTASQVLTPRRQADVAPTLWNTMNVAQESLIRGGLSYAQRNASGRVVARRRTREVGGIDQNTNINRALWALAEGMRQLKAQA